MTHEVFTPEDDTFIRAQKMVRLLGLPAEQERRVFEILEAFNGWDVAGEREACARLVLMQFSDMFDGGQSAESVAAAIRSAAQDTPRTISP